MEEGSDGARVGEVEGESFVVVREDAYVRAFQFQRQMGGLQKSMTLDVAVVSGGGSSSARSSGTKSGGGSSGSSGGGGSGGSGESDDGDEGTLPGKLVTL